MGEDLEADRGIVLVPVGVDVEDFDAGMVGRVGRLLCVGIDDVGNGVAETWRRKIRTGSRWWWRG